MREKITGLSGREIEDIELDRNSSHDEILVQSASYVDDGSDVSEEDLDFVQDNYYSHLYELFLDKQIGRMESMYEDR